MIRIKKRRKSLVQFNRKKRVEEGLNGTTREKAEKEKGKNNERFPLKGYRRKADFALFFGFFSAVALKSCGICRGLSRCC